jgi:polar amino acid transport system substrate-binding protein
MRSVKAALAVTLAAAGLSCAPQAAGTLEGIRQAGIARIGYNNEIPFAYYDTATRQVTGEAPEVVRHVLRKMGVSEINGILTEFGGLIPGINARRFDIIASGMYVTPPRCEQIAFSEPISCVGQAFLVKAGNPLQLHGYDDAGKHATARLGIVSGGIELQYARSGKIPEERITIFPDPPSAFAGLQAGRVDAMGGPFPSLQTLWKQAGDPQIEIAQPFHEPVIEGKAVKLCEAVGFRKEDAVLLAEFNAALKTFLGSKEHLDLVRPFGFTESEIPSNISTAELCRPWSTR